MKAQALGCLLAWVTVSTACSGVDVSTTSELTSCQPLAAETSAITLGAVIGAGQAADGTVYVIDRNGSELRGFVSEGGELYRQHVSGSGEVNDAAGETIAISLGELSPQLTLQVVTAPDGSTRMGVVEGTLKTKTFTIGEEGEELAVLSADDVAALPLHNYTSEIVTEYVATVEDEKLLVVLRPRDLTGYEAFRVFYGKPERLEECPVQNVSRAKDGGSTQIDFSVNGDEAVAYFPVELVDEQFTPGAPTLTIDDVGLEISLSSDDSLEGAGYFCRAPQR
ncbi:MAG TPA: hypothetical protein VHP33_11975 [Polyangiaceae bacterium]|nr:hypothetical protein [Polyangiaceae bacterium]